MSASGKEKWLSIDLYENKCIYEMYVYVCTYV